MNTKTSELIWQDEQHQNIFRIIDSLKGNNGSYALEQLIDYVNNHFSLEEKYMEIINYPDIEIHIHSHRKFEEKIKALISERPIFDEEFADELSTYLSKWLTEHIYGADKKLEKFILSSKYK